MQVVFRNAFYEATGFGSSARQLAYKLDDAGVDVKIEAIGERASFLGADELRRLQAMESKPERDEQILLTLEIHRRPEERERFAKAISCTMWETTKAPREMADGLNAFDGLVLPNEFNRQAFRQGGVRIPMFIAPYCVDTNLYQPLGKRERMGAQDDLFVFLSVFGWSDRKAPDILIRAFAQEFEEYEPVMLLIKSFGNRVEEEPRAWYEEVLKQMSPQGRQPRIRLFAGLNTPRQMAELYRGADGFVLPTRGEGVGLPILESMACGTPVIATGWSSHTEFLQPGNGYLIPYRLTPAHALHYTDWYRPDQLWAEADAGSLQVLMRRVYTHRAEAKAKAAQARHTARRWNGERTAQAFIDAIERIAGRQITTSRHGANRQERRASP